MNDKTLSFLGLCRRAGKTVIGAQTAEKSIADGKAKLVIAACDASDNSIKRVRKAAEDANVAFIQTAYPKEELSMALGKLCGVLAVTDEGFAEKLKAILPR